MKACKVDEHLLSEWIDGATGAIRYLGPALTEKVARKIVAAQKRTGQRCCAVIDLDAEMDRSGYGQTAGVRILHDERVAVRHRAGLRVAALTAPGIGVVWSPIAERIDPFTDVSVNGIRMEGVERNELQRWVERMMGEQETAQPASSRASDEDPASAEPEVHVDEVREEKIKQVEGHLCEHPPRDFRDEKKTEVYWGYVGFIEIHVTGAGLSEATTIAIPKELTELGLTSDLRSRLSGRMRIDLSDSVNLGASDVNRKVDAFREMFTKQMGSPLGRIYKKSEWPIMKTKWSEIETLVEAANEKIREFMDAAVKETLADAAKGWAEAIAGNSNIEPKNRYTVEQIQSFMEKQWKRRQRATRMQVQLVLKDLTWEALNESEVRHKIEEAYPELISTGLYKSQRAWVTGGWT